MIVFYVFLNIQKLGWLYWIARRNIFLSYISYLFKNSADYVARRTKKSPYCELYICAQHQLYSFLNASLEWGNAFRSFRWKFSSESYHEGTTLPSLLPSSKNKRRLFTRVKVLFWRQTSFFSITRAQSCLSAINCIFVTNDMSK